MLLPFLPWLLWDSGGSILNGGLATAGTLEHRSISPRFLQSMLLPSQESMDQMQQEPAKCFPGLELPSPLTHQARRCNITGLADFRRSFCSGPHSLPHLEGRGEVLGAHLK